MAWWSYANTDIFLEHFENPRKKLLGYWVIRLLRNFSRKFKNSRKIFFIDEFCTSYVLKIEFNW